MENKLPAEITWRTEKIGFEPPEQEWLSDQILREHLTQAKRKLVDLQILNEQVLHKKNQPLNVHAAENENWRYLVTGKMI